MYIKYQAVRCKENPLAALSSKLIMPSLCRAMGVPFSLANLLQPTVMLKRVTIASRTGCIS